MEVENIENHYKPDFGGLKCIPSFQAQFFGSYILITILSLLLIVENIDYLFKLNFGDHIYWSFFEVWFRWARILTTISISIMMVKNPHHLFVLYLDNENIDYHWPIVENFWVEYNSQYFTHQNWSSNDGHYSWPPKRNAVQYFWQSKLNLNLWSIFWPSTFSLKWCSLFLTIITRLELVISICEHQN